MLLPVPPSSTFPTGSVLCDVQSATPTQLTCLTRPHLAADASGADPMATALLPRASPPGEVKVSENPSNIVCFAYIEVKVRSKLLSLVFSTHDLL